MPSKAERRQKWNEAGENKVVLHMFPRNTTRPNASAFVIKLETFLRMAKIDYEVDFDEPMGSKGKSPWITFNKEEFSDSQFIIEHLSEKLDKSLNKTLDDRQKANARAFRLMLEEHLYFCLMSITALQKGKYMKSVSPPLPVPGFMQGFVWGRMMKNFGRTVQAQGIGRHSREDIAKAGIADLKALSDYLMSKNFMMGNEPCELDAVVFGFLCMVFAADPEDDSEIVKAAKEMTTLKAYFERMKEKYWPDWEENLYKKPEPKPKKAAAEKKKEEEEEKKEEKE